MCAMPLPAAIKTIRKAVGWFLMIWGGIRFPVDLLESLQATHKYAGWLYHHTGYLKGISPGGRLVTAIVLVTGIILMFAERIHKLLSNGLAAQLEPEVRQLTTPDALPELRPKIVPVSYRRSADGYYGLFVRNDGDPAFDVSIPDIPVGASRLEFPNERSGIDSSHGEVLFPAYLTRPGGSGIDGSALRDEMIRANLETITALIKYKDFGNQWYVTVCELARDVYQGVRAGYIGQRLDAPPLPQVKTSTDIDKRDKATSRDWNREWRELAAKFEKLPNHVRADYQCNRRNNETVFESWRLAGQNEPWGTLCGYAGTLLLKSPHILDQLSENAKRQIDPAWRWLFYLKENHRATRYDGLPAHDNQGTIYLMESIHDVASVSARVCMDCAAREL